MKSASMVFLLFASLLVACSGDDEPDVLEAPPATSATAAPEASATQVAQAPSPSPAPVAPAPEPTPAASPTSAPDAGLAALSLVYIDTSRGQGGDVYIAAADGANPRLVTSEAAFSRPLDVRGSTLAAAGTGGVLFIDLVSGEPSYVNETNIVFDGRFFDAGIFLYSLSGSCTQGGGALHRVELPAQEVVELVTSDRSLTIAGIDLSTNTVTLLPRGCDVGVDQLDVYDALTGQLRNTLAVVGCGWAVAAPQHNKAVVSWQACTPPFEHEGADATVYDFGIVGPTGHDVTAPDQGSNAAMWLPRPNAPQVALGTTTTAGGGPGGERGAGIYLLDLTDRQFTRLVEGEGAEQFPVAWSPDGRYLLYAIVEAQGLCRFAYVDAQAPGAGPSAIDPAVTFCGVNGIVVGWTELP